jgi:hypothetical protein
LIYFFQRSVYDRDVYVINDLVEVEERSPQLPKVVEEGMFEGRAREGRRRRGIGRRRREAEGGRQRVECGRRWNVEGGRRWKEVECGSGRRWKEVECGRRRKVEGGRQKVAGGRREGRRRRRKPEAEGGR